MESIGRSLRNGGKLANFICDDLKEQFFVQDFLPKYKRSVKAMLNRLKATNIVHHRLDLGVVTYFTADDRHFRMATLNDVRNYGNYPSLEVSEVNVPNAIRTNVLMDKTTFRRIAYHFTLPMYKAKTFDPQQAVEKILNGYGVEEFAVPSHKKASKVMFGVMSHYNIYAPVTQRKYGRWIDKTYFENNEISMSYDGKTLSVLLTTKEFVLKRKLKDFVE